MSSVSVVGLLGGMGGAQCEVPVAMWAPDAEDVRAWSWCGDSCVSGVDWSMYTALSAPEVSKPRVGYCYVELLDSTFVSAYERIFGAFPLLRDLLDAPLDIFDLSKLAIGVSLGKRRVMHVASFGVHEFARVAVSALSRASHVIQAGSLAEYVVNVYSAVPGIQVDTGWRVGASSADVNALLTQLSLLSGVPTERFDLVEAALVVRTAAFLDAEEKTRLRVLEAVGDNVLSLTLSLRVLDRRLSVQDYQEGRSSLTNNVYMASVAVRAGLLQHVTFMPGISRAGKTGASCFEAMLALVYKVGGMDAVAKLCDALQFYAGHAKFA